MFCAKIITRARKLLIVVLMFQKKQGNVLILIMIVVVINCSLGLCAKVGGLVNYPVRCWRGGGVKNAFNLRRKSFTSLWTILQ